MRRGSGDVLFSRRASPQVSLGLKGLTTVFGMGTGVDPFAKITGPPTHTQGNDYAIVLFRRGGDKGIRTPDLLNANQTLSQLSYAPKGSM